MHSPRDECANTFYYKNFMNVRKEQWIEYKVFSGLYRECAGGIRKGTELHPLFLSKGNRAEQSSPLVLKALLFCVPKTTEGTPQSPSKILNDHRYQRHDVKSINTYPSRNAPVCSVSRYMLRLLRKVNIGVRLCIRHGGCLPYFFSIAPEALFFHHFHRGSSLGLPVGVALSVPEKTLRDVFHLDVDDRHRGGRGTVDDCFEHHERLR